jgi:alkaline phosphatase D
VRGGRLEHPRLTARGRWRARPAVAALAAAGLLAAGAAGAGEPPLVTVGEVTATGAVVWARAAAPGRLAVEAWAPGAPGARVHVDVDLATDLTGRAALDGLAPHTRYRYRVTAGAATADGAFTTAPPPDAAAPVRLVWSGDLGGAGHCPGAAGDYPIFRAMAARAPDFFVFLGDTVYADDRCRGAGVPSEVAAPARSVDGFRAKHRHNRARPAV